MIFSKSSLVKTATALSLAGTVMLASIFPAHAGTTDPNVRISELGSSAAISFPGRTVEIPVGFRVPKGVIPETLRGTLQLPAEYSGGVLELYKDGRIITSVPIVAKDYLAPIEMSLKSIPIEDNRLDFSLRAVMDVVGDQWCFKESETTLLDAAVQFSGTTTDPSFVADYFPFTMRGLTIYTPADPSADLQEAALEIASSLGSVYRSSEIDVDIQELPAGVEEPAEPHIAFERQIVLAETTEDANTELINAGQSSVFLRISGSGEALYDQARLLTDSMLPLAADSEVSGGGFGDVPNLSTDVATLSELGINDLTSESVARTSVTLGIERSRLRTYSAALNLHLTGTYTPLPPQNSGQITFSVGDTILDSFTVDNTGVFDRSFKLPGELLQRYSEIEVEYKTAGDVSCGETQPIALNINSNSVVNSENSDTPAFSGFNMLPQAFQPSVDIALADGDTGDLSRAVDIITGIQSLSSQRVRPHLVDWDEAVASERPTIFIDAHGEKVEQLPTYLRQAGTTLEITSENGQDAENTELTRQLRTNTELAAGSLQAVWDEAGHRVIIVASSNDRVNQLDSLLRWLDEDYERWNKLEGEIIVQVLDRDPVQLNTAEDPVQSSNTFKTWIAVVVGISIVALIVAVSIWISKKTKRNSKSKQSQ